MRIKGVPVDQTGIEHWTLRRDRGLSYAAEPPPGTELVAGSWWPADYAGPPLVSVELRHTGGALARSRPHHGAISTLPGSYAMFAVGLVVDEASAAAVEGQIGLVTEALAPYDAGSYWNFAEEAGDTGRFFPAETYRRLQAVKAQYDPDQVFRANHPISPAE